MFNNKGVGRSDYMLNLFTSLLEAIGNIGSKMGTNACVMLFIDEPECPQSLIK